MPKKMTLNAILVSAAIILSGISFQACDFFKKKEETKAHEITPEPSAAMDKKLDEILEKLDKIEKALAKFEEAETNSGKEIKAPKEAEDELSHAKEDPHGEDHAEKPEEKMPENSDHKAETNAKKEPLEKPKETPDVIYKKAMNAFKSKKFEEAASHFDEIIIFSPDNDLVDNSSYWKGESFLAMKKYEEAVKAFGLVAEKYPDSEKAAAALLKQGQANAAMGNMEEARNCYRKTVITYPFSQPGAEAQSLLEKSE